MDPLLAVKPVMIFCGILLGVCYLALSSGDESIIRTANQCVPVALGLGTVTACLVRIVRSHILLWSPLTAFLGICTIKLGFGPLVYFYGSPDSITAVESLYVVTDTSLLRTNVLNCVAVMMVCLGYSALLLVFRTKSLVNGEGFDDSAVSGLCWTVAAISIPVKIGILWLEQCGVTSVYFAGTFSNVPRLTLFCSCLLFYLWGRGSTAAGVAGCLLTLADFALGLTDYSKAEPIIAAMMPFLGIFLAGKRIKILFFAVALAVGLIFWITPISESMRPIMNESPDFTRWQRLQYVVQHTFAGRSHQESVNDGSKVQSWWTRHVYSNVQAFCMDSYDAGDRGHTLNRAWLAFIPRFLWSGKPIENRGGEFYESVTGRSGGGGLGPTYFAEGYWNGGWLWVCLLSLGAGMVFAGYTKVAMARIGSGDLRYLPIAILGIYTAVALESFFLPCFVGGTVISIAFWYVLKTLLPAKHLSRLGGSRMATARSSRRARGLKTSQG